MTNPTHLIPGWLDDWEGCYTVDDGHPASYAHEAVATVDGDTVTLTCQCGDWTGSAPADTDEEPAGLFEQWRSHVYAATGRWKAEDAETGGSAISGQIPDIDAIRAGAPVDGSTVTALCDEVEQLRAELAAERKQATDAARLGMRRFLALKVENKELAAENARLVADLPDYAARMMRISYRKGYEDATAGRPAEGGSV